MIEVRPKLFVGNETDCIPGTADRVVVHACKHPCHQHAVGYRGNLPSSHPNYLVLAKEYDLYLNMIDPDRPLFMPPLFSEYLDFTRKNWEVGRSILVHCNQGESRAPTLAMMFMAKILKEIPDESFQSAHREFVKLYPNYRPGLGIQTFLVKYWATF